MKLNLTDSAASATLASPPTLTLAKPRSPNAILFYAGAIHACGDVHEGNTTTDFSDIEREKGITISSAAAPCS